MTTRTAIKALNLWNSDMPGNSPTITKVTRASSFSLSYVEGQSQCRLCSLDRSRAVHLCRDEHLELKAKVATDVGLHLIPITHDQKYGVPLWTQLPIGRSDLCMRNVLSNANPTAAAPT